MEKLLRILKLGYLSKNNCADLINHNINLKINNLRYVLTFFLIFLTFICCVSMVSAAANPSVGQLKIWELNSSTETGIPSRADASVYTAEAINDYPDTTTLQYNPSLKSIDYTRKFSDSGEMYVGGLYACTDCNLTFDIGLDRSWVYNDLYIDTAVASIDIMRNDDGSCMITVIMEKRCWEYSVIFFHYSCFLRKK